MNSSGALSALVKKTVEGLGYELVDVERLQRGLVRVTIDIERDGGISLEDCERVSDQLTHLFTVEDVSYERLEVSSPGVERELTRPAHFEAYRGRAVTVRLIRPRDGQRDFTGRLLEGADPVRLEMPEGEALAFSQNEISSVRAVDEYEDDDDEPDLSGSITED